MSIGLIGTKIGMTREFMESGQSVPVTVIKVEKGRVLDVITKEKRGYAAIKVGFFKLKNSKLSKQMKGYFAKKNTEAKKKLKESNADMIIANDIGRNYKKDTSYNEIVIVDSKKITSVPRTKKEKLSKIICKNIEKRF